MHPPNHLRIVSFSDLRRGSSLVKAAAATSESPFVEICSQFGFHVYCRQRFKLRLDAAESDSRMQRFLKIAALSGEIAADVAKDAGGRLLEHQGETLHLFFPSRNEQPTREETIRVFAALLAIRDSFENEVRPLARDDIQSFRITLDHGMTILVGTARNCDDSIISLAPAANRPAKEFGRDSVVFPADHVRLPIRVIDGVSDFQVDKIGKNSRDGVHWVSVPLRGLRVQTLDDSVGNEGLEKSAAVANSSSENFLYETPKIVTDFQFRGEMLDAPTAVRGWILRADLDGFSSMVATAFSQEDLPEAIKRLVREFLARMEDATNFDDDKLEQMPLRMPWAGDCAARIIASTPESNYPKLTEDKPAKICLRWHNKAKYAEWLVSIAGGNTEEGNGKMLVADILIDGNRYRIAAGWAVRRSKQGEQSCGGKSTDSVMHRHDSDALKNPWYECFDDIEGIQQYRIASITKLNRAAKKSAQPTRPILTSSGSAVPALNFKPYGTSCL